MKELKMNTPLSYFVVGKIKIGLKAVLYEISIASGMDILPVSK